MLDQCLLAQCCTSSWYHTASCTGSCNIGCNSRHSGCIVVVLCVHIARSCSAHAPVVSYRVQRCYLHGSYLHGSYLHGAGMQFLPTQRTLTTKAAVKTQILVPGNGQNCDKPGALVGCTADGPLTAGSWLPVSCRARTRHCLLSSRLSRRCSASTR